MRLLCLWLCVVALSSLVVTVYSNQEIFATEATELFGNNFLSVVGGKKAVLLEFYMPGCGHCQRFAPTLNQLASEYAGSNVIIARIDGTRYPKLADQYQVTGFPSFRFFQPGTTQSADFDGSPMYSTVKAFIEAHIGNRGPMGRTRFRARQDSEWI